jgi:hypothetical protein
MAQTSQDRPPAPEAPYHRDSTAWSGWVVFGGVILMTLGAFQVIEGLVALFKDSYYLVRPGGLVVNVDYTAWGWTHLLIGAVAIVTGLGLLVGNLAARIVGVGIAVLSAIVNLAFISAYPVWSTIIIALDVIVIFAIIVHGGQLKSDRAMEEPYR